MRRQVVVAGHGLAGTRFVEKLCGETGAAEKYEVTVLGNETRGGYNRVLLTEVLAGSRAEGDVFLHTPRWYADRGVTVRDGVRVVAIDRNRSAVFCDDGTLIGYDHLVLATGSSPVLPPIRGLRRGDQLLPGCFAFRTLADCAALVAAAGQAKRAVVVGGGVLGLEAARGLAERGLRVEVVHRPEFLMNNQLDAEAATVLRRVLQDMGTACYVATGASAVDGDGRVAGVRLSDRFVLDCELLVFSCGTRPNVQLAAAAGLATCRGVVVDDALRSITDPRILAIGDCAEHRGQVYGLALPALEQAAVAAAAVAHGGPPVPSYSGSRPVIRLKADGIDLAAMGDSCDDPHDTGDDAAEVVKFVDPVRGTYKKLVIRDGRLAGAVMFGDVGTVGTVTVAYDRQTALPPDRLHLLFGGSGERPRGGDPAALPDDALVCLCNSVPAADIRACVARGARSVADVAGRTRATTSCGTCRGTVAALLAAGCAAEPETMRYAKAG